MRYPCLRWFAMTTHRLCLRDFESLLCPALHLNQVQTLLLVTLCSKIVRAATNAIEIVGTGINSKVMNTHSQWGKMDRLDMAFEEHVTLILRQRKIHRGNSSANL